MLYNSDDYLNGLDPYVHHGYHIVYPETICFVEADYYPIQNIDGCELLGKSNPFLSGYHPFPSNYEIAKIWSIAKQNCNIKNEDTNILPDKSCLNERFGRSDNPLGVEKCRTYYFWGMEVKSRPCMIKNSKLEELDIYKICGIDDAFLCTKESVVKAEKRAEELQLQHEQRKIEEKTREAEKELFYSNPNITIIQQWRTKELSEMLICYQHGECINNDHTKNDSQCNTYNILGSELKGKHCMQKHITQGEQSLYEECGIYGYFICLKDTFKHQWIIDYINHPSTASVRSEFIMSLIPIQLTKLI